MRYIGWSCLLAMLVVAACDGGTEPGAGEPRSVTIVPETDTLRALQDTATFAAEVRDERGELLGSRVTWSSLDPGVARVDSLGRVVSVDVGSTRITAVAGDAADTARITVISGITDAQLKIVRFRTGARALETRDTSFWVVNRHGRDIEIRYRATGGGDTEEFLRFRIPGDALLRRPDGNAFGREDSVRIRLRVVNPAQFVFQFEPAGLRFDPDRPAELEVEYEEAEEEDVELPERLSLWRQEQPESPWARLATLRLDDEKVRARITGFTRFALATN